jgi:hypothetical protein
MARSIEVQATKESAIKFFEDFMEEDSDEPLYRHLLEQVRQKPNVNCPQLVLCSRFFIIPPDRA